MKYHFDVLPTKFKLATPNNNWDIAFLYNRVKSFSVGRTSILSRGFCCWRSSGLGQVHLKTDFEHCIAVNIFYWSECTLSGSTLFILQH